MLQFAVLAFQGLQLRGHLGGDTGAVSTIDLGLLDPLVQRLRRATNLRRIDRISDQRLSRCPALSRTVRTERSRTSVEYLFVVLLMMFHPTQELEPPANPERFNKNQKRNQRIYFQEALAASFATLQTEFRGWAHVWVDDLVHT